MRVIALMNQKGGVGKTTTTVNLGAALAEAGKKVCLIDLDPQAHLTINYGIEPSKTECSLYDVLVENKPLLDAVQKIDDKISVIPSSIDLAAAEVHLVNQPGRDMILRDSLLTLEKNFEFILIDCPPSLGLLTINALAAANEVLIPMQPHFLALQGVAKLLETVQLVNRRINPQLKVAGIVLTMYDAQTKLSIEVVGELNSFIDSAKGKPLPWSDAKIFKSKIRRNIKLAESPSFGQTIFKYDSASHGASDYRSLANEILGIEPAVIPAKPAAPAVKIAIAKPAVMKIEPPEQPIEQSRVAASPVPPPVMVKKPVVAAIKEPESTKTSITPNNKKPEPVKPAATVVRKAPVSSKPPIDVPPASISVTINPAIDATKLAAAKAIAKSTTAVKIDPVIEAPKLAAAKLTAKTPVRKAPTVSKSVTSAELTENRSNSVAETTAAKPQAPDAPTPPTAPSPLPV